MHVVSRETGYHGTHGYGTSITGIPPNRDGWGVLAGENTVAPLHDLDGVEKVFAEVGPERIAAFVIEPVTGAGGVHLPTDGYVEGVAELWVIRHGETEWSRDGLHTSHTELELTAEGEEVARKLAERLEAHAGYQAVEEMAVALPFSFEPDDYRQILTDLAEHLGPALGWSPAATPDAR